MSKSDTTFCGNVTPNTNKALSLAEHIAVEHSCLFVGTEHLILALLKSQNRILPWIKQKVEIDLVQLQTLTQELVATTSSTGTASFYSPSLTRSLQIAKAIWSPQPVPTEGVLLGALLAHEDVPNAAGAFLRETCATDLLPVLHEALPFVKDRLRMIPSSYSSSFGFTWDPNPVKSISKNGVSHNNPSVEEGHQIKFDSKDGVSHNNASAERGPPVPLKTHWVVPGKLLCGSSPGNMDIRQILALVESGVNTFVCLQEEYTEYGCRDYRGTLRDLARSKRLPEANIEFLHCPMPDFGVLKDDDLLGLIAELRRCLEKQNMVLYIHCYGGHGRTGTVLINLLEPVLGLTKQEAMQALKQYHEQRGCKHCALNRGKLEDSSQERQTERLQPILYDRSKKIASQKNYSD